MFLSVNGITSLISFSKCLLLVCRNNFFYIFDFVSSNLINLLNNYSSFSVDSFLFSRYSITFLWIRTILVFSSFLLFIFICFTWFIALVRISSTKLNKCDSGHPWFIYEISGKIFNISPLSRISMIDFWGGFPPCSKFRTIKKMSFSPI